MPALEPVLVVGAPLLIVSVVAGKLSAKPGVATRPAPTRLYPLRFVPAAMAEIRPILESR